MFVIFSQNICLFNYLSLHAKHPQNLLAYNRNHFNVLTNSDKDSKCAERGWANLGSMISGTPNGKKETGGAGGVGVSESVFILAFSHSSVSFLGLAHLCFIPLTHILWPSQEVWSITGWLYSKREWTENIPEGEQSRTLGQKLLGLPWHSLRRYIVSLMPYFINGALISHLLLVGCILSNVVLDLKLLND